MKYFTHHVDFRLIDSNPQTKYLIDRLAGPMHYHTCVDRFWSGVNEIAKVVMSHVIARLRAH